MLHKANRRGGMVEQLESRTLLSVAEPNNTFATAVQVGSPSGFGGTLTFSDSVSSFDSIDIYKFFTPAIGDLSLKLANPSAPLKLTLVHDKNFNGVEDTGEVANAITANTPGGTLSTRINQFTSLDSFFIKVERATFLGTSYSLQISFDTAGTTSATARALSDANGAFGRHDVFEGMTATDTVDLYSFTLDPRVSSVRFGYAVFAPTPSVYQVELFRDSNNNNAPDSDELFDRTSGTGSRAVLSVGARYFLRLTRTTAAVENYTLQTWFDNTGDTIFTARNIGSIDDQIQNFREQSSSIPSITSIDSDDFYRFTISSPQEVCLQLINLDSSPATNQLSGRIIRDANNNGVINEGEELALTVAGSNGVATLNFPLTQPTNAPAVYFLDVRGTGNVNYSLAIAGDRTPGIIPSGLYNRSVDVGSITGRVALDGALGPTDSINGDPSDTFKFNLPFSGKLKATLIRSGSTAVSARLNADLDKDGFADSNELLATFDTSAPLNKDLAAGTYFITIIGQTSRYNLELIPDFAGDTPETARNLGTLGAFTSAQDRVTAISVDPDFYKFAISSTQTVSVATKAAGAQLTVTLLKDLGGGTLQLVNELTGTNNFTFIQNSISAGTYFVRVGSNTLSSDYTVGFSTGDNDDSIPEVLLTANNQVIVGDARGFTIGSSTDVDMIALNLDRTGDTAFAVDIDSRNGSSVDTFIRLFDSKGNQLATNDDGAAPGETVSKFSFINFTLPANYTDDFVFIGVSSALNKGYNPLTGGGDSGGSSSGQYTLSITKPLPPATASISGSVFNDINGNGALDGGETGIAGRSVYLDLDNDLMLDSNEMRVLTDSNGKYLFANLPAATYKVREAAVAGWTQTFPTNNFGLNVTITGGETISGKNFFTRPTPAGTASISGTVFQDFDRDGVRDTGDNGLSGFVVYLDLDNDSVLDTNEQRVLSDSSGNYNFINLAAGTYKIRVVLNSGFVQTTPANNFGQNATLTSGQAVTGKNFGVDN